MNFNDNDDIKKYINLLKENIESGIKYEFVDKIEKVFKYLENNKIQLTILKNKIKKANSVSLFFDFLVELLVFYKHIEENPEFLKEEKNKTPDIKTNKNLIEVKRIRLSNYQKDILDQLSEKKVYKGSSFLENIKENDNPKYLIRKVEEKIDKAVKQLNTSNGIIYIVYSLDLCSHLKSLEERKNEFEKNCFNYFESKKINNIKLEVIDLNILLSAIK